MRKKLEQLRDAFLLALENVSDASGLEELRVEYLGRKGRLAELMKQLPDLAEDVRKDAGKFGNEVKKVLETAFLEAKDAIERLEEQTRRETEWIDITIPGKMPPLGSLHLVTQTIEEVSDILERLGFVRSRTPEVEWDWYAFESLNMPKDHAARDEWETFFIADDSGDQIREGEKGKVVLTPHTSNSQVREIEKGQLPIRMFNIGKSYRRQSDISHVPMFHQFEGLLIDEGVTITQLKGVFDFFVKHFFGSKREVRLRPHHFRFTEPSFELDISCDICKGTGEIGDAACRMCKEGWLELGGAGMVHPNVIKAGGLDPEAYSGFAFGWGIERTLMMRSGMNIDDMRIIYRNDLRFLRQF